MITDPLAKPMSPSVVKNPPDTIAAMSVVPAAFVIKIDHVGVAVPDLDAAIAFYERAFGFRVMHEEVNEEQGVREAMLAVGDHDWLQLLAPLSPESTIGKFIDRSGPGIQQIAYQVHDVRAVAEHLRDAGVRVLYDEPKVGTAGSLVNFAHPKDCGGVLIELVESTGEKH
jgi:methylmalonyl-CoA/ethylmalonyl-CoA epimerase